MREIEINLYWDRKFILFAVGVTAATFLGPFGTYDLMNAPKRFVFWAMAILAATFFGHLSLMLIHAIPGLKAVPWPWKFFAAVSISAVPTAFLIFLFYDLVSGHGPLSSDYITIWMEVVIISFLLATVEFIYWPVHAAAAYAPVLGAIPQSIPDPSRDGAAEPASHATRPARLMLRLPDEMREATIVSMSMQDHYVEITTSAGTALLLLRLGDAIDLLDGFAGLRLHRSHWVALSLIEKLHREGRRYHVLLKDGRSLPVSNTYLADVQAAVGH